MSIKILLIDDEPDHILVVKARLEAIGHEVIGAQEGKEGLNLAKTKNPDLIILDITMPDLNGFQICRLMKADPNLKNIPILIFTALGSKNLAEKCLEAGADDLIQKPWEAEDLEKKINALLNRG